MTRITRPPWLGIELRHLAALDAVAREASFRAAADRLGYVQSAVSQQIAHLEEMVGARLVDRKRGASRVVLTEAGELLLHHVDEVLARISAAQADMEALQSGRSGQLRVGVYESVTSWLLPRVLASFGRVLPGVEVQLEEARPHELAAGIEQGRLDAAFGDVPLPSGPFDGHEIARDRYVLLAPSGWPIAASDDPPARQDLARIPLIGNRSAATLEAELRADGTEPRYAYSCGSDAAVQALVAAGLGAAIVPQLDVGEPDEHITVVDVGALFPPRVLTLYWHRARIRPSALDAFLEVTVEAGRDASRAGVAAATGGA